MLYAGFSGNDAITFSDGQCLACALGQLFIYGGISYNY